MKYQISMMLICLMLIAFSTTLSMADLMDGLVAFWAMEDGSGNTAVDATGNGHDGSLENSPTWATGGEAKMGKGALVFDGKDDRIVVEAFDVIDGSGITLAAWIRPTGFNDDARVISKAQGGGTPDHYWAMVLSGNGENGLQFRLRTDAGATSKVDAPDAEDIEPDVWTHVALTWDADDPNMRFYKNGTEIHVAPKGGGGIGEGDGIKGGIENQSIDAGDGNMDRPFTGSIDDVAIWDRGLTPKEISEMMNDGIPLSVEPGGKLTATWGQIKSK